MLVYWRVRIFTYYKVCLYSMCVLQRHIAVSHIVHGTKMINIKFAQSDHSSSLKRVPWPSNAIQRGLLFFVFLAFGFWLLLAFGFCWLLASVGFRLLLAFGIWLLLAFGFWLLLRFVFLFSVGFWLLASVGFYRANPSVLDFSQCGIFSSFNSRATTSTT